MEEAVERQLNQRINSINFEPIGWCLRIIQVLPLRAGVEEAEASIANVLR
jgi:hypothetical protein